MNRDRPGAPGAPDTSPATPPSGGWVDPSPAGWVPPPSARRPLPSGWEPPPPSRGRGLLVAVTFVLAAVFVFSLGLTAGQADLVNGPRATPVWPPAGERPTWQLLDEAFDILDQHYVDQQALDPLTLERGAVAGLAESLDDPGHTAYLTPEEVRRRDEGLAGTFVGIGAVLDQREEGIFVVRVLRDSPAERAGLRAGEQILTVDGEELTGLRLDEVVLRVRGPEGTQVTLELRSPDGTTRTLTITRARIELPLVSWAFAPGTRDAVIRIEAFASGAGEAFETALREALAAGVRGIVLDLRGNPGGFVNEPVAVAGHFLRDAVVYLSVDQTGAETPHRTGGTPLAPDLPLVVLVDAQTASAAEILTGALQDAGRAAVIGVTTFGTGTVVGTFPLADGGALMVGTERWLTPDGRAIWREGLAPDEVVELPIGVTLVVPDDFAGLGPDGIEGTDDAQLLAALRALDREQAGDAGGLDRAA